MPVDDTATPSFGLNKQSLTKLRILNDKVSSALAQLVTPTCFLIRSGVTDSDIDAVKRLVEHTNSVIEANASRQSKAMFKDLSTLVDAAGELLSTLPDVTPSTSSESDFLDAVQKVGAPKMVTMHAGLQALLASFPEKSEDMFPGLLDRIHAAKKAVTKLSFSVSLWSTLSCLRNHQEDAANPALVKLQRRYAREALGSFIEDAPCPDVYEQQLRRIFEGNAPKGPPPGPSESEASALSKAKIAKDAKVGASGKAPKGKAKAKAATAKTKGAKASDIERGELLLSDEDE